MSTAAAYLFGSRASGRAQAHSDIDVAVRVDAGALHRRPEYGYAAELAAHLMSALGSNDVDVVILNGAPPVLYHRVLRDGRRILSRDPRATAAHEGYALSRYCDYREDRGGAAHPQPARPAQGWGRRLSPRRG
ncbi:MAG: type VII toxin-antitoxin system MntA family adenylyltransferase antitoxin [Geminicoccales bacterium]